MMTTLFNIAGIAMIGWALMILLPGWSVTRRLVEWTAFPVVLAGLYLIGIGIVFVESGIGVMGDFGSAEGVIGILSQPNGALVAWIHILTFDHLVGVIIFRDNLRHEVVSLPVQSVILFFTLMLGPVGFLSYWVLRTIRGPGPDLGGGPHPVAGAAPEQEARRSEAA